MAADDMALALSELEPGDVDGLLAWRYEAEYGIYDMATEDRAKFAAADSNYLAVRRDGELVGFVCLGAEARVLGMEQDPSRVDLGVGLRPALTGHGASRDLMPALMKLLQRHLGDVSCRAAIAVWNDRAQRAANHAGFTPHRQHQNDRGDYLILVRDRSLSH